MWAVRLAAVASAVALWAGPAGAAVAVFDFEDYELGTHVNVVSFSELDPATGVLLRGYFTLSGTVVNLDGNRVVLLDDGVGPFNARQVGAGGASYVTLDEPIGGFHTFYIGLLGAKFDLIFPDGGIIAPAPGKVGPGTYQPTLSSSPAFGVSGYIGIRGFTPAYIDNIVLEAGLIEAPEPATWALMILGFGLTGAVVRRRARATG